MKRFNVLVADPPWKHSQQGGNRGASRQYPLMTVDEICAFELPPMEDRFVLFLWRVASMQEEALQVARAWGAVPKAELVWLKQTRSGKQHFGMGAYTRAGHEACLIASTKRPLVAQRHSVRSTFTAPTGAHSEKPDRFYELVEQMYPDGRHVELFARKQRPGWSCFGHDLAPGASPGYT